MSRHVVGGTGFTSTDLWRQTLEPRENDACSGQRERLRAAYLSTRDNAAVLLNELSHSMPDFTVHDITHVDALWEMASLICDDHEPLNPAEAFVLGCSFVLHDAAMGLAAYPDDLPSVLGESKWRDLACMVFVNTCDRWPTDAELADLPGDVRSRCLREAIRQTHAEHASTLVEQSWPTTAGNDLFLIEDVQLRESYGPTIGDLASSHWWDVAELPNRFRHGLGSLPWQPSAWTIEPLKLACILRLADATQIDSRRAPTFLFSLRDPKGSSRDHWFFQEHISRPQLTHDRITYTALRPFREDQDKAWWLALDYLRDVDAELKKVDALLHDLKRPRLAARAVGGVDLPERFAELFPVRGWRPVDVGIQISNVRDLVRTVGGEQLYGNAPEVAVRELIQNAQDAVCARQVLDPSFSDGRVEVSLTEEDGIWTLEVSDNGIGMDEDIIVGGLLDFGRTGWRTDLIRTKFVGLGAHGFRPHGRFGIGFFSVFMIGDDVSLLTRRFDGGRDDARRLHFNGLEARPLLTGVNAETQVAPGSTVKVILKNDPVRKAGILFNAEEKTLSNLVHRLMPESSVPVTTTEWERSRVTHLPTFDMTSASATEIFDRLYPPRGYGGQFEEMQRRRLREEFVLRATEMTSEAGERLGFGVFGHDLTFLSGSRMRGVVTVDGFRGDEHQFFSGYTLGRTNKASRDNVELAVTHDELARWVAAQETRLRDLNRFDVSTQLEHAFMMYRILGHLSDDHHVGWAGRDIIQLKDIEGWASEQSEILFCSGWPLSLETRPPRLFHYETGRDIILPDNWFYPVSYFYSPLLDEILSDQRDPAYEHHRHDRGHTWQKEWWRRSGNLEKLFFTAVCRSWSCDIGDILSPVADRDWSDHCELEPSGTGPVSVYRLRRP